MKLVKREIQEDYIFVTGNKKFLFFQTNRMLYFLGYSLKDSMELFFRQFKDRSNVSVTLFINSEEEASEMCCIFSEHGIKSGIVRKPMSKYCMKKKCWVTKEGVVVVVEMMNHYKCILLEISEITPDRYENLLNVLVELRKLRYKTLYRLKDNGNWVIM